VNDSSNSWQNQQSNSTYRSNANTGLVNQWPANDKGAHYQKQDVPPTMQSSSYNTLRADQPFTEESGQRLALHGQMNLDQQSRQPEKQTSNGKIAILQLKLDDPVKQTPQNETVQKEVDVEHVLRVMEAFYGSSDSEAYKQRLVFDKRNNVTQFAHCFELQKIDSGVSVTDSTDSKSNDPVGTRITEIENELNEMKRRQSQLESELGSLSKNYLES